VVGRERGEDGGREPKTKEEARKEVGSLRERAEGKGKGGNGGEGGIGEGEVKSSWN